ncbi:MAG: hypothetical protein WCS96_05925 [Victivallales bacterium]
MLKMKGDGVKVKKDVAFLFSGIVVMILLFVFSVPSFAAPGTILYSGKLLDASGNIINGNVDMTVTVYDALVAGTALYVDRNTAGLGNPITVTDGIYSVVVGDDAGGGGTYPNLPQSLASSDTLFLQITIGADDLSPREKLQAVPYAVNSGSSSAANATRELTNLQAVAVNTAILPAADAAVEFGSATKRWTNVFLSGSLNDGAGNTTTIANIATLTGSQAITNKTINPASNSVTLTDGSVLIGNGSNVAAAQTVSGDVTVSNTGVAAIQPDSVTTAKILDNNVTLAKIADGGANQVVTTDGANNPQWENKSVFTSSALAQNNIFAGNASNVATVTANLPDVALPTGGNWTLSSNLNLDSDTLVIDQANNRVGIGTNSPTAVLQLKAGTASAAPLKLTSGISLTAPEDGAVEYDGVNLYVTPTSLTRKSVSFVDDAVIDPRTFSYFFDDFETATTTGIVWTAGNTGTTIGNQTVATVTPTDNAQGVLTFSTRTAANGGSSLYRSQTGLILGKGEFTFETRVKVNALSTAAQEFAFAAGLHDSPLNTAKNAVDGVYFIYDRLVSGTNWQCVTSNNSTRTTTNSGVLVTAGDWVRLEAVVNADGTSVTYYIDDMSVATITTNIPTAAGRVTGSRILLLKSAGTQAKTVSVDYWYRQIRFMASR